MKTQLTTFTFICFGLSIAAAGLFRLLGGQYSGIAGALFATGYMLIPLLSVIATQSIFRERLLSDCGISFRINRWWVVAWIGMLIIPIISTIVSAIFPGTALTLESDVMQRSIEALSAKGLAIGSTGLLAITLLSGLLAGATTNALFAFGEEAAWRGYMPKLMQAFGFWKKSLIIGVIWGLWHAPLILMGHNYPSHPVAGVFMMTVFCTLLTPVFLYLRERSTSVIAVAIAHGTMNATAGISLILLSGYDELLCGVCGLAGMIVLLVVDLAIYAGRTVSTGK